MSNQDQKLVRQREVMYRVLMGQSVKTIALELKQTDRTIYRDIKEAKEELQKNKEMFYIQVQGLATRIKNMALKLSSVESFDDQLKALSVIIKAFECYESTLQKLNLLPSTEQLQEQEIKIDFINPWGEPIERIQNALRQLEQDDPEKYKSLRGTMLVSLIKEAKEQEIQKKAKLAENTQKQGTLNQRSEEKEAKDEELYSDNKEIKQEEGEYTLVNNISKESKFHIV